MYRDIEFVCAGNNGRSPVAETVAKNLTSGFGGLITVSSSGTMVDLTKVPNVLDEIGSYVRQNVAKGVLKEDRLQMLQTEPYRVLDELFAIERDWRNTYLHERFRMADNHTKRQTVVRPQAHLILTVDELNLRNVRAIYATAPNQPTIATLPDFVGSSDNLHPGSIKDYASYKEVARKVEEMTRRAIEKVLGIIFP